MTYTEHDLRELLDERGAGGSGGAARLEEILRRGRAVRRRRRLAGAAGAFLASGAVAAAVAVPFSLPGGSGGGDTVTAARSMTPVAAPAEGSVTGPVERPTERPVPPPTERPAARPTERPAPRPTDGTKARPVPRPPEPGKDLPASLKDMDRRKVTLIGGYRSKTTGTPYTLRFTPTSRYTGLRFVCAEPGTRLVVFVPGGSFNAPCPHAGSRQVKDKALFTQHSPESAGPAWVGREQTHTIWVVPPGARRISFAEAKRRGCAPRDDRGVRCGDGYLVPEFGSSKELIELRKRPGRWAVGVYDRPAS
ncbi:hypothetical protein [Streptosporangium pseudovulgare]|uniref:Rieske domain-containing protein n=1 Tax=Streptosporangium pseudovulgare TaxID=35765 RepID=A0ABQ2QZR2_9ACTN|nr:hypothetical protein [Streptosporangium pseudovulgare]GGQ05478.1 hypothetical protein GCM10010140_39680 [Streptosporangium pseudovulgare]